MAAAVGLAIGVGCSSLTLRGPDSGGGGRSGRPPTNPIYITPNRVDMSVDQSVELEVKVGDMAARVEPPYQWSTENSAIATVAGMGLRAVVTGHGIGRTLIRFETGNGFEISVSARIR